MAPPTLNYGGGDRLLYAQTQVWAWLHYLRLFVLPAGLTADTDLRFIGEWYDTRVIAGLAAIAGLAVVAWRSSRRRESFPVVFGLAWFAVGLLPTSSILPLAELMNEHRVFLPFIGLALAAVWGARLLAPPWLRRPVPAAVLCAVILVAHATGTSVRNRAWRTGEGLWADVTVKSPANGRAWMNYGVALMARGEFAKGAGLLRTSGLLHAELLDARDQPRHRRGGPRKRGGRPKRISAGPSPSLPDSRTSTSTSGAGSSRPAAGPRRSGN